jgi:glycerol-3-phosphate cytidylyltransferase
MVRAKTKVALLIPCTSRGRDWHSLEETYLFKYSIKTFLLTFDREYDYKFFIGIDRNDRIFDNRECMNKICRLSSVFKNVNFEFIYMDDVQSGHLTRMWNILFQAAYDQLYEYFFQCGDDIIFTTKSWVKDCVKTLEETNGIGLTGPINNNNRILTQAFVSRRHMEIFGFFFPEEIINWCCDDWYNLVYQPKFFFPLKNHYCSNEGGAPRYHINNNENFGNDIQNNLYQLRMSVNNMLTDHQKKLNAYLEDKLYPDIEHFISTESLFFESSGFTNSHLTHYSKFNNDCANVYFKIMNSCDIEYFVFAGTMIGYMRDGYNIPWVDDYDIIIFEEYINDYKEKVLPILQQYGFKNRTRWGYENLLTTSGNYEDFFYPTEFEIFTSQIKNDRVYCLRRHWGRYNLFPVTVDMIRPCRKVKLIDVDTEIPVFQEYEKDIKMEYGDINDNVCIHIKHKETNVIRKNYKLVYKQYYNMVHTCKQRTEKAFGLEETFEYANNLILRDKSYKELSKIAMLRLIASSNTKNLYIFDFELLKFSYDIKLYFPNINIYYYHIKNIRVSALIFNSVDHVMLKNMDELKFYDDLHYAKKPKFDLIKCITFGTFDLLHHGHKRLFENIQSISDIIHVGISTDKFNEIKGKKAIQSFSLRKKNIEDLNFATSIFPEESFEKKKDYILQYDANLIIMGDDWSGKFDDFSCPSYYFPRTPNISSTMLRKEMLHS